MEKRVLFNIKSEKILHLPVFVESVSDDWLEVPIEREKGYPAHQISVCLKGKGTFEAGGSVYEINPGDFFFFRKDFPHNYFPCGEWKTCWVAFDGNGAASMLDYFEIGNFQIGTASIPICQNLITLIYDSAEKENHFKASFLLQELLFSVFENSIKTSRLQPVLDYIKKNYQKDIQLEDLADILGTRPSYFCRIFKKELKMTPFEYVNQYRINISKAYLLNPDFTVKQTAQLCGFKSLEYFCSVFKKIEGCSSTDFRRRHGVSENSQKNQQNQI
ncbi:MAG: AraC family transcriptional regulator [Oscillospiraceae bacterium]|nr:AraC family transcriptional regulator [Oscillospiraceae bacterium]